MISYFDGEDESCLALTRGTDEGESGCDECTLRAECDAWKAEREAEAFAADEAAYEDYLRAGSRGAVGRAL